LRVIGDKDWQRGIVHGVDGFVYITPCDTEVVRLGKPGLVTSFNVLNYPLNTGSDVQVLVVLQVILVPFGDPTS
jgi:hypothetical protein